MPEVRPAAGEVIIDKPGKGAFYATDLDLVLRLRGITHMVLTGIATEAALKMITMQGGVFGAVATSDALLQAVR